MPIEVKAGVVLASGMGRRLQDVTRGTPKCFYRLPNKTALIDYPVSAMIRAGVRKLAIVVPKGHAQEALSLYSTMPVELKVIENSRVDLGNAYSLVLSLGELEEQWAYVACCDTIFPHRFLERLSESSTGREDALIAISESTAYVSYGEASKVIVDRNWNVVEIGKHVESSRYVDTGVFLVSKSLLRMREEIEFKREVHLYELFNSAARMGYRVRAVNMRLEPWTEIDCREDLESLLYGRRREVLEYFVRETGLARVG